jgi:hypothetical protein
VCFLFCLSLLPLQRGVIKNRAFAMCMHSLLFRFHATKPRNKKKTWVLQKVLISLLNIKGLFFTLRFFGSERETEIPHLQVRILFNVGYNLQDTFMYSLPENIKYLGLVISCLPR